MSLTKEINDKKVNFEFNKEFINVFNKNLSLGGNLSKTTFFFFSSKFSIIFNALSDSKRFKILAIDSVDRRIKTSVWIDSFNSMKISGSRLNPSNLISLDLFPGIKFSIILAESAGCSSFKVLFKKFVSLSLIFLLNRFYRYDLFQPPQL